MSFGYGFGMFGVMFTIVFVLVIGTFIATAVSGIAQWSKNNNSPRLTVDATVVAKRQNVSHHRHANAGDMAGGEYGLLVEGDYGKLSFQGTRYLGFERM